MLILDLHCCRACSLLYRLFLSVTKLVALEKKKVFFRMHILLHVLMLLIILISSDNVYEYPSRLQLASWWLWKSHVKLLRTCAFQITAIVEHHISTSVLVFMSNLPKHHCKWVTLTFPYFWAGCCIPGNSTSSLAWDHLIFGRLTFISLLWEQSKVYLAGLGGVGYRAPCVTAWKALDIRTRTSSIRWLNQHLKG